MADALDTISNDLNATYSRLAELEVVPVAIRARMTYSDGQQTYGWNEYRESLLSKAERLEKLYGTVRDRVRGPFTVSTGTVRG